MSNIGSMRTDPKSSRGRTQFVACCVACAVVFALGTEIAPAGGSDPQFEVTTLAAGFKQPTALQQATDGRLFVAQKEGSIQVFDPATSQTREWAHIDVISTSECGLIGLALHPDFSTQPFVYVFATVSTREQRIIRFRDQDGIGVEPTVIRDSLPTQGANHDGGCLRVGPDGMLYFSVGDNGMSATSQSLAALTGKICRVRLDGSVPDDNPFTSPTGAPRSIYALGFRNPFRFCFAPDGRLFVMDVGSSDEPRREEINLVSAGDNCGWPLYEGSSLEAATAGYVNPIFEYHDEGSSITGCVVYDGRQFPSAYRGNLFHLDYTSNGLFRAVLEDNHVVSHVLLVQGDGGTVDLTTLQDGTLAYSEFFTGKIRRVRYIGPPEEQVGGADPNVPADTTESSTPSTTPSVSPLCGHGLLTVLPLAGLLWSFRRWL